MLSRLTHVIVVFFIVYASLFGGVVETQPLAKIFHQIAGALIVAAWLTSLWLRKQPFPITRLNWPFWALGIGWLLAAAFGEDPRVSFEFAWATFIHIILFFIALDIIRNGHQRWLFEGLFLTGGVIVILGALEMIAWYFGWPFLGNSLSWPEIGGYTMPPVIHELSLPLNHNNPTGAYAVLLIPITLVWSNTTTETDLKWGLRALAAALVGIVVFTQSRGAYLAFAAMVGFTVLIWLLRSDVRAHFPQWLQPFIAPRVLLALAVVGGVVACIVLYQIIVNPSHPNPNDVTRISLWYSAVRIFEDHPVLGIGPSQFKALQLVYGNWERTYDYLPLNHAHNLFFNVIAEGGIVLLTLAIWLLVRTVRVWRSAWTSALPPTRRRLEGMLVAMLAFGVHNMVDAFLQTQFMIPMLIILAYVTTNDCAVKQNAVDARDTNLAPKLSFGFATLTLIAGQIAFLPLHLGAIRQQQFSNLYADEQYEEALEKVRSAQNADPWLDLYVLEEAMVLGQLANDTPTRYLDDAIRAFEVALDTNATWDIGWHNLAALYAQAGYYEDSIAAQETAYRLNPMIRDYLFAQAKYHELSGHREKARSIYLAILGESPWLAASEYWRDPNIPTRAAFLDEAIEAYQDSAVGIDLIIYSGQLDRLDAVVANPDTDPPGTIQQLAFLWPKGADEPCVYCYHTRSNPTLNEAEIRLHTGTLTSEEIETLRVSVSETVFEGDPGIEWGWYILARLLEREGGSDAKIDGYLARAVSLPPDFHKAFPRIYLMQGDLDVLPQARVPRINAIAYEPWIVLAQRQANSQEWDSAENTIEAILELDPYATGIDGLLPDNSVHE